MPTEAARTLLRDLLERATAPDLVYTHRWQSGDIVMWDNRCMLHRGRPWDVGQYRRVMHRTTVAGDGPTAPDIAGVTVAPAREADRAWCRVQLTAAGVPTEVRAAGRRGAGASPAEARLQI